MEKRILIVCCVALLCLSPATDAFVRRRRSNEGKEIESQPVDIPSEDTKDVKPVQGVQTRKRRQWNNDMDSMIREIFYVPPSQPDNSRIERDLYVNQPYYPNNYLQQQPQYNRFPVYGPPQYQPNNFAPAPVINNHYIPAAPPPPVSWWQRFYCYYPIIITIPTYTPGAPPNNNIPTNVPSNGGDTGVDLGNRFGDGNMNINGVDTSVYNTSLTGISLDPIPPIRPPTVTQPPLVRPDDEDYSDEQLKNQGAQGPQGPQGSPPLGAPNRPPQAFPTRPPVATTPRPGRPSNNYPSLVPQRPGNSINNNDPVYFPEEPPQQNNPNRPSEDNPNACVEAIVFCCLPNRRRTVSKERCFDINGCPSSFFGMDPCETRLANEALRLINMRRRG